MGAGGNEKEVENHHIRRKYQLPTGCGPVPSGVRWTYFILRCRGRGLGSVIQTSDLFDLGEVT